MGWSSLMWRREDRERSLFEVTIYEVTVLHMQWNLSTLYREVPFGTQLNSREVTCTITDRLHCNSIEHTF